MNPYTRSLDTDMAIGSILSNFESTWIMHTIQDSLNMRFRPYGEPMPNFVDILDRQFRSILDAGPDYKDQICQTRDDTYIEIINTICGYYNLEFTQSFEELSPIELYGITRTLYDIFISRFSDYIVDFYIQFIMNNIDSIYAYLAADETIKKPREKDMMAKSYISSKFQLIHANLNKVIMNMGSYDIPLESLLLSFTDPVTAARLSSILSDKGDIYKNYYAIYLTDQRYMAELLTCIKLKLQSKTQEAYDIATPSYPGNPAPEPEVK